MIPRRQTMRAADSGDSPAKTSVIYAQASPVSEGNPGPARCR